MTPPPLPDHLQLVIVHVKEKDKERKKYEKFDLKMLQNYNEIESNGVLSNEF